MPYTKRDAIKLLEMLPDSVSLETIIAEFEFVRHVEEGLAQIERGEVVSHEEALERIAGFLTALARRADPAETGDVPRQLPP